MWRTPGPASLSGAREVLPLKSTRRARYTRPSGLLRAAVILILVTLAGGLSVAPAQAAAYRYWGYFHVTSGAWAFAQTGPAQAIPADGSVDGWRFAVADESSMRTPRATPAFETICAGTAITAGHKRVGLVIDFGRPGDAPDGAKVPPAPQATCVAVPTKASGSDVLVAAGNTLRLDKALTCGIDGWPATGCGRQPGHQDHHCAAGTSGDVGCHGTTRDRLVEQLTRPDGRRGCGSPAGRGSRLRGLAPRSRRDGQLSEPATP